MPAAQRQDFKIRNKRMVFISVLYKRLKTDKLTPLSCVAYDCPLKDLVCCERVDKLHVQIVSSFLTLKTSNETSNKNRIHWKTVKCYSGAVVGF